MGVSTLANGFVSSIYKWRVLTG